MEALPQDGWIAAELALPGPVTQYCHRRRSRSVAGAREGPAYCRRNTEHLEEIGGYRRTPDQAWCAVEEDGESQVAVAGKACERAALPLDIQIVGAAEIA